MEIKSEQTTAYSLNVKTYEKKQEVIEEQVSSEAQVTGQENAKDAEKTHEAQSVTARKQLNQSILQASLDVNLSVGNEPMALLLKTALEGINKALEGQLGPNAIQNAYESGIDVSPQATADRIVQMSTAFFDQYYANHSDLSLDEALSSFTELIGKGIDNGFKEARDILDGLGVLKQGDISSNIDKTYDLVQEGLKAFVESRKSPDTATPEEVPAPSDSTV